MLSNIRSAQPGESRKLTEIAYASKRYWNYPEEYFETWRSELTITESYLTKNQVFVGETNHSIVGFYSIVYNERDFWTGQIFVMQGYWLDHLFITPDFIGKGIGTQLFRHAKLQGKTLGGERLLIFADPNATSFYDKMGAKFLKDSPSSIPGRTLPIYEVLL